MTFLRPDWLWLLLFLPLLVVVYAWRARARAPLAFGAAAPRVPAWQRHGPVLLIGGALGLLVVGAAGPNLPLTLPVEERSLLLALDVSGSMQAQDVAPNRLAASQAAAKALVASLPSGLRVGVVAYADSAALVQPPSARHGEVMAAIDSLQIAGGTAIGDGLRLALAAIFPGEDIGASAAEITSRVDGTAYRPARAGPAKRGSFSSAAIVLLTDGQNSVGSDPLDAARLAAERGVKVYTIGFGTAEGSVIGVEGATIRVRLDEEPLKRIADLTGGEYFRASSGLELRSVYDGLQGRLALKRGPVETTALFAGVAALLIMGAAAFSLARFGRIA